MPELAKLIEVEREGGKFALRVDGEDFPWYCAPGIEVHVSRDDPSSVTLTLVADEVRVVDRLRPPPPPEVDWMLKDAETGTEIAHYVTNHCMLEGDIVTAPDGAYWQIQRIDAEAAVYHVVPYKLSTLA